MGRDTDMCCAVGVGSLLRPPTDADERRCARCWARATRDADTKEGDKSGADREAKEEEGRGGKSETTGIDAVDKGDP